MPGLLEDFDADFNWEEDELDFADAFSESFDEKNTESGYDRGYAEGAAYVASEIDEALGCEGFIDCDCRAHRVIRRVLLNAA